jgi:ATP-dependent DNA helicase RecG
LIRIYAEGKRFSIKSKSRLKPALFDAERAALYDNRVEISNPGGLLIGVKNDFGKKSMTRNPLIFGLFTRMSLVEQVASGIPRMRKAMKEAELPEPTFTTDGGFFTVEFKRPQKNDTINDIVNSKSGTTNGTINGTINSESPIEEIVLKLIAEYEGLSARKISKLIDKSLRTTMRYLDDLKKSEKIEFRGALKNGGYYLK